MLSTQSPYPSALSSGSASANTTTTYMALPAKKQSGSMLNREGVFSSPTESEFSDGCDGFDSIRYGNLSSKHATWDAPTDMFPYRSWDEKKVAEWLHTIRCGQYESIFKGKVLHLLVALSSIRRPPADHRCLKQQTTLTVITSSIATRKYCRKWGSRKLAIEFAFPLR